MLIAAGVARCAQEEKETAHEENIKASSDKKEETDHKNKKKGEENKEKKSDKKGKSDPEKDAGSNDGENEDKPKALKRGADALEKDDNKDLPDIKKPKLAKEAKNGSPQPEDEDGDKPMPAVDAEKAVDGDSRVTEKELRTTLRIDNFVRPFTLNAVKTLVQELGNFVEDGFWMDAIKTHCFVTYPTSEIVRRLLSSLPSRISNPHLRMFLPVHELRPRKLVPHLMARCGHLRMGVHLALSLQIIRPWRCRSMARRIYSAD
ncbi:hypothetical protein, variant 8 [Phytophthora nicotianae]|uniref:Uncharacterized protein n=1 Tax=Phytophthora nicotianae TaxID=4792 RepID=W2H775_PHYNI|nr:hypothetical protein, variant 7 [Phytophthora nicotianae]ETK90337.1 hypothetical protein, variant 8 [Phytophthora nicotianae]